MLSRGGAAPVPWGAVGGVSRHPAPPDLPGLQRPALTPALPRAPASRLGLPALWCSACQGEAGQSRGPGRTPGQHDECINTPAGTTARELTPASQSAPEGAQHSCPCCRRRRPGTPARPGPPRPLLPASPWRVTCQAELGLGLDGRTHGRLLEQDSLEPQSRALANQGDHAQAPLTPGRQVRPAQLAFTSHQRWLRAGQLPGGVRHLCQGTGSVGCTGLGEGSPQFPQTPPGPPASRRQLSFW